MNFLKFHSFLDPLQQETLQTWDRLADLYWDKFSAIRLYDASYDAFLEALPDSEHPAILDLCCGPGNISDYLVRQNPALCITLADAAPNMVKKAVQMVPGATGMVLRTDEIDQLEGPFDGIVFGFGIPFLSASEVVQCLTDCYTLLRPDGILYLSFVPGDHADSGLKTGPAGDRTLFYYYPAGDIIAWCQQVGFSTVKTETIQYPVNESTDEHVIAIFRKEK